MDPALSPIEPLRDSAHHSTEIQALLMDIDFCVMSTNIWLAASILFISVGVLIGFAGYAILSWMWNHTTLTGAQTSVGCLIPVLAGPAVCYGVYSVLPVDPCEGGHTADVIFIPLLALFLVAVASLATFLVSAWRR